MPNVFLSGGGGKSASSVSSCPPDVEGGREISTGERGLLVMPEMGDGGTKGKDSRIESSPAEAAERTDPLESL
jgi:hypothetical protein